ncbi:MAG: hypothetical protein WCP35_13505 [Verrucomicrobiota bacterium]
MDPSAFDRLIAMLPPERRAAAAVSLVGMSDDPDGPIATLYSEILERLERIQWEQRADHETREKQLLDQLEKARMANQETIRTEVSRLHQGKFWHRMLVSRFVSAAIWLVLVAVATPIVARHVMHADLTAQQQAFQSAQAEAATRLQQTLKDNKTAEEALAEAQRCEIERINNRLAANICKKSFEETVGHVITANSPQVKTVIGPEVITLRIQDSLTRKEQGIRIIEIKHGLTPVEFEALRKSVEAAKSISITK